MAACTWPECIWCFQKSMVVCCDRSLWGVLSLERSMEMGSSVKDSLVCACRSCDCMSSYLRLPEKKYAIIMWGWWKRYVSKDCAW